MNTTKHDRPDAVAGQVDCRVRPECRRCALWEYTDVADDAEGVVDDDIGTCHRWPPVLHPENEALRDANGNLPLRAHTTREWAQPMTLSSDWCGEFRPNAGIERR